MNYAPASGFRDRPVGRLVALAGLGYLLAVQAVFALMPFRTETPWLWLLQLLEGVQRGEPLAVLADPEWWLGLSFPVSLVALGALGAYAYLEAENPLPAAVAAVYLTSLIVTELVFVGRFEYAILYIVLAPVVAILAAALHLVVPRFSPRRP